MSKLKSEYQRIVETAEETGKLNAEDFRKHLEAVFGEEENGEELNFDDQN